MSASHYTYVRITYIFYVYTPPCVCPSVCFFPSCVCPLRVHPPPFMSPPCRCPHRVYVPPYVCSFKRISLLVCVFLRVYVPLYFWSIMWLCITSVYVSFRVYLPSVNFQTIPRTTSILHSHVESISYFLTDFRESEFIEPWFGVEIRITLAH